DYFCQVWDISNHWVF
nr:immunoglobulin light chain junction region [Macaca mulatta]MOX17770.1 immunoglobulin light chain junction region [Macaca mulatta]MOX17854.1 immunoglobulin light chain junction region [Macaca mulatta]MOX19484.1 immunoglobulin light chain junction region [Macaca mulatta]MOX20253.1 immunoglobulin light chain junction region [Macaca mulatta]